MHRLGVGTVAYTIALPLLFCACATNTLHEYDYRGRDLSVVSDIPIRPEVLSGSWFDLAPSGDLVRDIVRAGAQVAKEIEARQVQERLNAAAELLNLICIEKPTGLGLGTLTK